MGSLNCKPDVARESKKKYTEPRNDVFPRAQDGLQDTRKPYVIYAELTQDKTFAADFRAFKPLPAGEELGPIRGRYSFCILETLPENGDITQKRQHMLMKPMMSTNDSLHGCFELFKKRVPGYNKKHSQFIVGGEAVFDAHGMRYDCKSDGYSNNVGGLFHYDNPELERNIKQHLLLPLDKFCRDTLKPRRTSQFTHNLFQMKK